MGVRPDDDLPPADRRTETLRHEPHEVDLDAGSGGRPVSHDAGRATRVPGGQGEPPEPFAVSDEAGSVEMARSMVPGPEGDSGELPHHPLDGTPPMEGTSEQARPVDGVRITRPG